MRKAVAQFKALPGWDDIKTCHGKIMSLINTIYSNEKHQNAFFASKMEDGRSLGHGKARDQHSATMKRMWTNQVAPFLPRYQVAKDRWTRSQISDG